MKIEDIYLKYKGCWEIEESFDYLKNSLRVETLFKILMKEVQLTLLLTI